MNDWRNELAKKYPKLYKDYGGDMRQTCMFWGFEVGDGWRKLLEELSENITKIDPTGRVIASQVKEKFGGLRFYFVVENDYCMITSRLQSIFRKITYRFLDYKTTDKIRRFRQKFYRTFFEKICDLVDEAENRSYEICELCGKSGRPNSYGWIRTLCEECRTNKEKDCDNIKWD